MHICTYAQADEALAAVGLALNAALGHVLLVRSDPFFACFPGGGTRYGAHFDGGARSTRVGCKLTSIVYANAPWEVANGGELHMLDERQRCWHTVTPRADRVVFFRADSVLHIYTYTHVHIYTCADSVLHMYTYTHVLTRCCTCTHIHMCLPR